MSEINRYISFIKNQSIMDLNNKETEDYLEYVKENGLITNYIGKMNKINLPIELENSILENNINIDWLSEFIEKIIKNDLKEILNNKKILDYIKNVHGRNF